MDESDKKDYLNSLEKHAEHLRLVKYYSVQRIDLLIISISGAGLYACFEIMKYIDNDELLKKFVGINASFKWSGLLFTLAIIVNFISQWTAYKGGSNALESTKKEIESIKYSQPNDNKINKLDRLSSVYNKFTVLANLTSNGLMILGLLVLILSLWNLF